MTFLVIDQSFQIFSFFSQIFPIFAMLNVIFDPFLTRKTPFVTLFILLRASDNTTSLNIGGPMHGPSSTSNFWGDRPPVPLRYPPLLRNCPGGMSRGREMLGDVRGQCPDTVQEWHKRNLVTLVYINSVS